MLAPPQSRRRDDMTTTKPEKSDEILEMEVAAMTVLDRNRKLATYEEFRELFAKHLREVYCFSEFDVKNAVHALDTHDVELPARMSFVRPPYVHEAR
jgi:hypothetical protein